MSEASRRSRVTITLGRTGQVVNRSVSESDAVHELPRAGTKRSVKERLGYPLDSSFYGSEAVSKRQRGEGSFSENDLQISKNDLRFKLMQKNAQRRAQSDEGGFVDLREKLSRSEQPPRSLDTRPRMAEPRDGLLPPASIARGSSQMLSPSSCYSPWTLEDIRRRSPERFVGSSRGLSPPRNDRSNIGSFRALSPPRNAGRIIGTPRDLSPPRNAGRIISTPRDLSPPRNTRSFSGGGSRALSPPRNTRSFSGGGSRALSPPRNTRSISGGGSRALSPPRNTRSISGGGSRPLSPPRNARSISGGGSRALSPPRNGGSYMGSSRGYSPDRTPGSYMGSSRGSPPPRSIEGFHGRNRMLDNIRPSPYPVSGVINGQASASGAPFPRPMLPPPVPNPHPLPPLSQLPPLGNMLQNSPFPVQEPETVDSFLESIGLGKYSLAFKREELDMTTIKQMKESDLKDLIIPMGPRKKILQAIACLPKR